MYPSVYFILLLVTLLAQAPPPIENKYPKGLPATLAGFEDEAKFIVIVGDDRPGTMTSSWRKDGSYTATTEVTVAGQKVTRSTAITPDADGRWKEIRRTPYKKDLMELEGRFWARRGYVYAVQDCRGRFGSQGTWEPFIYEARDGCDTVEWLAVQPWSTGKVGMIGASYVGWVQWWAASARPPQLVTIIPNVAPPEAFYNIPYEYGAFFLWGAMWWADVLESNATADASGAAGTGNFENGGSYEVLSEYISLQLPILACSSAAEQERPGIRSKRLDGPAGRQEPKRLDPRAPDSRGPVACRSDERSFAVEAESIRRDSDLRGRQGRA